MVDNATNVLRIIFIVTFSLIVGAFGLYNAWQIGTNSKKSPENLETQLYIGAPGASFLLAAISLGALLPYSSHALRCNIPFCQSWRMWRNVMLVTLVMISWLLWCNWIIMDFPDPPFSTDSPAPYSHISQRKKIIWWLGNPSNTISQCNPFRKKSAK